MTVGGDCGFGICRAAWGFSPFLMPDLTRVKSGIAPTPLALRLRLREIGPLNLPLAGRSDGPLAPGFHGRCVGPEAIAFSTTPNHRFALSLPAGFDTRQIRQRLPALGQVLPNFQLSVSPQPPFSLRLAPSGNRTDQPGYWQVTQTVLWHPVFWGGAWDRRR